MFWTTGQIPMRRSFLIFLCGTICSAASASWLPAQSQLVSPRVIDEPMWTYPLKAAQAGVREGEARAIVSISEEGVLLDFMIVGCTHLAFAEELVKALPKYRFAPARLRGEPTTVRMPLSFFFKQEGTIASLTPVQVWEAQMARVTQSDGHFISFICPQGQLDQPLKPVKVISPAYPAELLHRGELGTATIDFFVDGAGNVRLPAADVGTHRSFTREAVRALTDWKFEPPTSRGQPVIVRVSQTFRFLPPEEPASASAATSR
jgi:TonB family protein